MRPWSKRLAACALGLAGAVHAAAADPADPAVASMPFPAQFVDAQPVLDAIAAARPIELGGAAVKTAAQAQPQPGGPSEQALAHDPQVAVEDLAPDEAAAPAEVPGDPANEPEALAADAQARLEALLAEAKQLDDKGKRKSAMELYQQALAMNPNSSLALSRLAFGYLNRGENEQAMQFASRAVAIDPTSSEGWIVLGAAQHATGEREKAREAYRNCVEHGQGDYITECRRMAR
jgi:tetratricopeptide (TPR) repeat protein